MSEARPLWFVVLILAFLAVAIVIDRRSRRRRHALTVAKSEGIRDMSLEWMPPVVEILIIGGVFWTDVTNNPWHIPAALIGIILGALIGVSRARASWVRAEPAYRAVIIKRGPAEFVAFAFIVVVKMFGGHFIAQTGWISWALTTSVALVVTEAISRVAWLYARYRRDRRMITHQAGSTAPASASPDQPE